ncbi:MAG: hypothetical protein MOGMAGMI_00969 [Candidatus Omnitrophica bacterium]|nr:hypothetical protein [Candidatus Omnitrophota bacterium]
MPDPRRIEGFTLLEITLAAILFAVAAAGVLSAFANASRAVTPGNNTAHYLAAERHEILREAVRQDWWGAGGNPLSPGGPTSDGTITLNGVGYDRQWTVVAVNADGAGETDDYRRATVRVEWTEP